MTQVTLSCRFAAIHLETPLLGFFRNYLPSRIRTLFVFFDNLKNRLCRFFFIFLCFAPRRDQMPNRRLPFSALTRMIASAVILRISAIFSAMQRMLRESLRVPRLGTGAM